MSKFLDKLFESKNFINDPDEVARVTDDMAYCRLYELSADTVKLGQNLLKYVFLPTDEGCGLRYGELAGLLRVLCCDHKSSDLAAHLRTVLINKTVSCMKAKMFKMVTLRAFANFVDTKTGTVRGSSVYNRVRSIAGAELDFTVLTSTTFNDLFNAFNNRMSYWNIACTLEVHAEKTSACCQIAKLLLIDCFRFVYSGLFVLNDLKNRLVESAEKWETSNEYEEWYSTEDKNVSKYDNVDQFGDEYDTEATEAGSYGLHGLSLTDEECRDWDKVRLGILNGKKTV